MNAAQANEYAHNVGNDISELDALDESYLSDESIVVMGESAPTDAERLAWCLKYGVVGTLGVVLDIEYIPLTLDLIDKAIAKAKGKE